jgi:aspartyl-tRNA(Asn)/glutamyl-tRNA(Gln) amidotransferase subunit C
VSRAATVSARRRGDEPFRLWYIRPRMAQENAKDNALLGEDEVRRVAKLARLDLTDGEVRRLAPELSAIVGYVRKLEELDTKDVEPTAHVRLVSTGLRADEPRAGLSHDDALAAAPRVAQDGFAVPAFVDD